MTCERCGAEVAPGLLICPQCGARMKYEKIVKCPACGKKTKAGLRLCPSCGAELEAGRGFLEWRWFSFLAGLVLGVGLTGLILGGLPAGLVAVRLPPISLLPPTPTSTPTITPTFTFTPTPTSTSTSTPTPTETATPTSTFTPTSTNTPIPATPTPTPTLTPTPTPTSPYVYRAPRLLEPKDKSHFSGGAEIILRWEPPGNLREDEWYGLSLRFKQSGQTQFGGARLKENYWRVPQEYAGKADEPDRTYEWDVVVVRVWQEGSREVSKEISPKSETWVFHWR